jgi:hypothetical protein
MQLNVLAMGRQPNRPASTDLTGLRCGSSIAAIYPAWFVPLWLALGAGWAVIDWTRQLPGSSVGLAERKPRRQSLDTQARYRPRDDELLDLAGALEDRVDLGVAVPALYWVLAGVAVAAEDLNRFFGDSHRGL